MLEEIIGDRLVTQHAERGLRERLHGRQPACIEVKKTRRFAPCKITATQNLAFLGNGSCERPQSTCGMCAPSASPSRMRGEQSRRCAPHPQGRCAANANPMERKRDASREARMRSTQIKSHLMGITIAHGPGGRAALRVLWRKHEAASRLTGRTYPTKMHSPQLRASEVFPLFRSFRQLGS